MMNGDTLSRGNPFLLISFVKGNKSDCISRVIPLRNAWERATGVETNYGNTVICTLIIDPHSNSILIISKGCHLLKEKSHSIHMHPKFMHVFPPFSIRVHVSRPFAVSTCEGRARIEVGGVDKDWMLGRYYLYTGKDGNPFPPRRTCHEEAFLLSCLCSKPID